MGAAAQRPRPTLAEWKTASVVGLLLFLGDQGSTVWAVSQIPSGLTAVLGATMPIWILVLGWIRPGGQAPSLHEVRLPHSPLVGIGTQMICGGVLLCLMAAVTGEWGRVSTGQVSLASGLAFVYLTVFGSLIGYSLYAWLLRVRPPAFVSTYGYINPAMALLLGWALAEERLNPRTFLASAVILGAVIVWPGRQRRRSAGPVAGSGKAV